MSRLPTLSCVLLALAAACGGGDPATPECTTHEGCPAKQYCDEAGACAPLAAGACRKVTDCDVLPGGPAACVNDACAYLITCRQHEECPAHQECNGTTCQALAAGACHRTEDCAAGEACSDDACLPECEAAANVARRFAIQATQPVLAVDAASGKKIRTFTKTFASLAAHPEVQCPVPLRFRDLSGDGALQPYEDWTLGAAERTADLVERLGADGRRALVAHPALSDVPAGASPALSARTAALVDAGVRFGLTSAATSTLTARAAWANALQARCEASPLGVPFVLSMEPAHTSGPGRVRAKGFSAWPPEAALAAAGDRGLARAYGSFVSQEYRAIGVRMALSPAGDLATDPRWPGAPWTFGEDASAAGVLVEAFVEGAQGDTLGRESVAVVLGHFPGAGAARGGVDARIRKGMFTAYTSYDAPSEHISPFRTALAAGVAGVMTGYGIPQAGAWWVGNVNGNTTEQVGASFHAGLVKGLLRGTLESYGYGFDGLVVAPPGAVEDAGLAPFGAPWGVETLTKPQRIAKAVGAGVDQLVGLSDLDALAQAALEDAQVRAAARRALLLTFKLGLFEDPYVDAAAAPSRCNTDAAFQASLRATYGGLVLLRNAAKPAGFLNGDGDGTQLGDPTNAGNGTLRVLPAPPGTPYGGGVDYYVAGDFDLAYVQSVAAGYGSLTNDAPFLKGVAVTTAAERMALSDYVFVRIRTPEAADPESGPLALPLPSLTYAGAAPGLLAPVQAARAAIGAMPGSKAQLVVIVDAGRPSVVAELLAPGYALSALYVSWSGAMPDNPYGDKVALDLMFGFLDGAGRLPFALPASDAAAAAQKNDVGGDGSDGTLVRGYGLFTQHF